MAKQLPFVLAVLLGLSACARRSRTTPERRGAGSPDRLLWNP